jgi:transcriptional regulator with XRE-family HTH domain
MEISNVKMVHVGSRIEQIIKKKKVKQSDVCEFLKISRQSLNNLFKSEHIKTDYLFALSEYLEVPITYFLGWELSNHDGDYNIEKELRSLIEKAAGLEQLIEAKDDIIKTQRELIDVLKKKTKEKQDGINT